MRSIVIFIVFIAATSILSSVLFLKGGLEMEAELSVSTAPDITVEYLKGGRLLPIPSTYIENIKNLEMEAGISKAVPRIWGYAGLGSYTYVIVGTDLSDATAPRGVLGSIEKGRFLGQSDAGSGNIVIGKLLQHIFRVDVGDKLIILNESSQANYFTVVGLFSDSQSIYTADMIVMSIEDARKFFNIPTGYVTDIMVYLRPGFPVTTAAQQISNLPNARVMTQDLLEKALKISYSARGGFFTSIWSVMLVTIALVAFSQAIMVGRESRFEVGLLKTFGFTTLDIIEVRLFEGVLIGLISTSMGIMVGIVYSGWLNAPGLIDTLLGWAYIPKEFLLPIYIKIEDVLSIYSITIVTLLIATVVPAWLNAIVDPDISMRRAAA